MFKTLPSSDTSDFYWVLFKVCVVTDIKSEIISSVLHQSHDGQLVRLCSFSNNSTATLKALFYFPPWSTCPLCVSEILSNLGRKSSHLRADRTQASTFNLMVPFEMIQRERNTTIGLPLQIWLWISSHTRNRKLGCRTLPQVKNVQFTSKNCKQPEEYWYRTKEMYCAITQFRVVFDRISCRCN